MSSRQIVDNRLSRSNAEPLVEVNRGPITESRHRGHVVAVTADDDLIAAVGAPDTTTYLRSSAKPFQALPVLVLGAADRFDFTDKEVALACASHNGEPIHTEVVAGILKKIGLGPEALKCGVHEPFSAEVARKLREARQLPNVLQNNCSGKHAAMLALARHIGAPTDTYNDPANPVQIAISEVISEFSGVALPELAIGIDGCSVPVFGMPIRSMALAYARLVCPPSRFATAVRKACERIVRVMSAYPELIGGTSDRLDTEIMRAAPGRLVSKVGAEGVYTAGIVPGELWPHGFGLAIKIEDGDDHRARPTAVIEALRQLGVLKDEALEAVSRFASIPVRNRHGNIVGGIRASFSLGLTPNKKQ